MTYEEELNALKRELDISFLKLNAEHRAVRAEMIEKHGEEWVLEIEKQAENG